MKSASRLPIILILIGFICLPGLLGADIAPLQVEGGSPAAKSKHETIRMESEEVNVRLEKRSYTVDAVFDFMNTGETATEWVGFPKQDKQYFSRGEHESPRFTQFHVWVNGKKILFPQEDKWWIAGQVTFPGNAKTTIRVMYEAGYRRGQYATYVIGTGAPWKGKLARAAFTVDGSGIGGTDKFTAHISGSKGHRMVSKNAVRIVLKDYEPNGRLSIDLFRRSIWYRD